MKLFMLVSTLMLSVSVLAGAPGSKGAEGKIRVSLLQMPACFPGGFDLDKPLDCPDQDKEPYQGFVFIYDAAADLLFESLKTPVHPAAANLDELERIDISIGMLEGKYGQNYGCHKHPLEKVNGKWTFQTICIVNLQNADTGTITSKTE